jgi:hypothetical protein
VHIQGSASNSVSRLGRSPPCASSPIKTIPSVAWAPPRGPSLSLPALPRSFCWIISWVYPLFLGWPRSDDLSCLAGNQFVFGRLFLVATFAFNITLLLLCLKLVMGNLSRWWYFGRHGDPILSSAFIILVGSFRSSLSTSREPFHRAFTQCLQI